MDEYQSLNHTKWECKYHVVFIPKCRRKVLYGELRRHLGTVFRRLTEHKESRVEEGHLMPDHVHMLLSIPPKYSVAQVVGYMKGKSAIHVARSEIATLWGNTFGHECPTSTTFPQSCCLTKKRYSRDSRTIAPN